MQYAENIISQTKLNCSCGIQTFSTVTELYSSLCSGLTQSNYKELNALYEKYKNQGWSLVLAEKYLNYVDSSVSQYLDEFQVCDF